MVLQTRRPGTHSLRATLLTYSYVVYSPSSTCPPPCPSTSRRMFHEASFYGQFCLVGHPLTILQDELSLEDRQRRPAEASQRPVASRSTTEKGVSGSRPENLKPGFSRHRPTKSQEDALRTRRIPNGPSRTRPSNELDIFADPSESARRSGDRSRQAGEKSEPRERRPRRNSDTSILERKPLDPEEEKKRQERRRRERERRRREDGGKDKDGKPKKPSRKLDVIDQLDATSIYGTGCMFRS